MITELAPGFDQIELPVPLGVRLRDSATGGFVGTGLTVSVERKVEGARRYALDPTPSAHWVNQDLMNQFRSISGDPDSWPANSRDYRFQIDDPTGQFLPLRLVAKVPARGALIWPDWPALPPADYGPLMPVGAVLGDKPHYLPLFPSSSYSAGPLARVHAHLALRNPVNGAAIDPQSGTLTDTLTDKLVPAAWSLVTVTQGTRIVGIGLADAGGAVGVYFPYPLLPDLTPQQKTQGRAVPSWDLSVAVYCDGLGTPDDPAVVPDLKEILTQLTKPPRLALKTTALGLPPLGTLKLEMGKPLVLRSESPPGTPKSSLYLNNP